MKSHNIADLRRGKTHILRGDRLQQILIALGQPEGMLPVTQEIVEESDPVSMVPVYDVRASMGAGSVTEDTPISFHIAFRKEWLRKITSATTDQLAAISASGDSMEPTLSDGDTVLIDMTQRSTTREDGIYVIDYDGLLLVKRLRFDPARRVVRIISDNPKYPPTDDVSPEILRVFGRAIWLGRKL